MKQRLAKTNQKKKGSVLLASVVLMSVASASSLAWVAYVNQATVSAGRDRDRMTAFYCAEAGIERVVDFMNNPDNFTNGAPPGYDDEATQPLAYPLPHPNVAPAQYPLFQPYTVRYATVPSASDPTGYAPVYIDGKLRVLQTSYFMNPAAGSPKEISKTSKIPTMDLPIEGDTTLVMYDNANHPLARVTRIRLVHPSDLDAAGELPDDRRVVTKVIADAETPAGVAMTVESLIVENPDLDISAPGAIITEATATLNGHLEAYWGEVWLRNDYCLIQNIDEKIPEPGSPFRSGNNARDPWFRLVESRLLAFLLPWLADREVAEEVAQEALILLYRNRDKISSGDKIVPWLFVTARRLAFKVARKSRQAPAAYGLDPAVIDEFADHCRSQLESLSLGQLASVLSSVLATLESEEREIISLRYFSNLKHAEIAEVLDMPIGSVGVKLRRTLDKLKDRLTEKGISPESF